MPKYNRFFKYAYLDEDGIERIPKKFETASKFACGLAAVKENSKTGFIDKKGQYVIEPRFDDAYGFCEPLGLAPALEGGKWGIVDTKGNWHLKPHWDSLWDLNYIQGTAHVEVGKRVGIIDLSGSYAVKPKYRWIDEWNYKLGVATVESYRTGKYGLVNRAGKVLLEPCLDGEIYFRNDIAKASIDHTYGFINDLGQWLLKPQFKQANNFSSQWGVAAVEKDDGWGVVDGSGKWLAKPTFDHIEDFDNAFGIAVANKDGQEGYIDIYGNWVVGPYKRRRCCRIGSVRNIPLLPMRINDKWGYTDLKGKWVIKPQFEKADGFVSETGVAEVVVDGKHGLIDYQGNWVVQPVYDYYVEYGFDGLLGYGWIGNVRHTLDYHGNRVPCPDMLFPQRYYGVQDAEGKVVLPMQYEEIRTIDDKRGIIDVETNCRWGQVDFQGQWVTEPTYVDYYKMKEDKGNEDKEDDNN